MRGGIAAVLLIGLLGCAHAPPPSTAQRTERRDEWLLALGSDVERIGGADGFEGAVRVVHGGKPEIDRAFGQATCLPLGTGRRVLATLAVALLVEKGKLSFGDRLERVLPSVARSSLGVLTVENLLTDSAGLALTAGRTFEETLEATGRIPLDAAPGTRIDPEDDRPWLLVERVVAQVSGQPFDRFVEERVATPAGLRQTSLGPTPACPEARQGTTSLDDQFRLVDALRTGKIISAATRDALWTPRLPLGPGSDVGLGFFIRTRGEERAVGRGSTGAAPAYELWLDPGGGDALVLLGRTGARTARGVKTALAEFYALPPGPSGAATSGHRPSR